MEEIAIETATGVTQFVMIFTFVQNIVMSTTLSELWGSINQVELASLIPVLALKFPLNALNIDGFVVNTLAFDII